MESGIGSSGRMMTVIERKFIENALRSGLRIDGRHPSDYRRLKIQLGREDGTSEVQLGETLVMAIVTVQLAQPFPDRPNEGTLAVFADLSPMADPSCEPGRPGESAVELGRILDRSFRESRALDMESLCVLPGKLVWSIRIDLHVLDDRGNVIDAANIAALAALLTFRRPECTLGGEDGQQVIVHPPEVREPLPLIVHHLPIAITFALFRKQERTCAQEEGKKSEESSIQMVDPTHLEEAVMGGRMTVTVNENRDICAIQKPGGFGISQNVIMSCLETASEKAADITRKINTAVTCFHPTTTLLM